MTADGPPPSELLVDAAPAPGDASQGGGPGLAPVVFPIVGCLLVAKYVSPNVGIAALGLCVVALLYLRTMREGRFVLRVQDGILEVTRERPRAPGPRISLGELDDVTLERRKHNASGRGGASAERVRLALERRAPLDPVFFPDEAIASIEGQEWQGKVRVFLRKHGWVPRSER